MKALQGIKRLLWTVSVLIARMDTTGKERIAYLNQRHLDDRGW